MTATATSRSIHVTRRGRLVLVLSLAALLFAAFSIGRARSEASTSTPVAPQLTQVTVQPGETLWAVAQRVAPDNDPRDIVQLIRRVNHLSGSGLQVGQQLLLPAKA